MVVAAYQATDAATRTGLGSGLERFGPSGGRELRFLSPPEHSGLEWNQGANCSQVPVVGESCLPPVQIVATHVASQTCEV